MQSGWGNSLRKIDRIHDRIDAHKPIALKDALFVAWQQYMLSSTHFDPIIKVAKKKKLFDLKLEWEFWKELFPPLVRQVNEDRKKALEI